VVEKGEKKSDGDDHNRMRPSTKNLKRREGQLRFGTGVVEGELSNTKRRSAKGGGGRMDLAGAVPAE
jgi:hypothetical protein